jgi:hypothetical protein
MGKTRLYRHEISGLVDRLNARGTSRMLRDQPELTSDMRTAAAALRGFLDLTISLERLEIDPAETPWQPRAAAGEAK